MRERRDRGPRGNGRDASHNEIELVNLERGEELLLRALDPLDLGLDAGGEALGEGVPTGLEVELDELDPWRVVLHPLVHRGPPNPVEGPLRVARNPASDRSQRDHDDTTCFAALRFPQPRNTNTCVPALAARGLYSRTTDIVDMSGQG